MSELYAVRVAARPDDRTIDLDIKVVHPDSMHIPVSPGFALMLLHDRADGDAPLAREVDLQTVMNRSWATANARAFVESVELLSVKNEVPQEAVNNYEHGYWRKPKGWLEARLRVRATHPAWVSHVPNSWDSASFDPAGDPEDYEACPAANPEGTPGVEIVIEADYEHSDGFLAAPKLAIVSEVSSACPDVIWVPRHGVRAYEVVEPLTGIRITLEQLADWLGKPVMWRGMSDSESYVGVATMIEDDRVKLVSISDGGRSTHHRSPSDLQWIGLAAFRRGTPRLAPPLELERMLSYVSPVATLLSRDGCKAMIGVYQLHRDDREPQLTNASELLRLLASPAKSSFREFEGSSAKLGRTLHREMDEREIHWPDELYPQVALGILGSFELEKPRKKDRVRKIDLDDLGSAERIEFIERRGWPQWKVHLEVSDEAWLEHLEQAGEWEVDGGELPTPESWDDDPLTYDPDRDDPEDEDEDESESAEPPAQKSTLRRRFELPGPVTRGSEPLGADDPRAVLRDHGLCEEVERSEAQDHFEGACKGGNLEAVRAYVALGINLNSHAQISHETPLIRAAEGDQSEVVRVLAAAGVDLQGRDGGGDTALMSAINWSHPEVLRTLLEVGASPDVPDNYENYPLVKALEGGDDDLIAIMLASKASPNAGGATKDSALHWCLRQRDGDRLRELLARPEADRNLATATGDTLLHLATYEQDADSVEALLEAGADASRGNDWGWNPRDVAVALDAKSLLAERFDDAGVPLTKADAIAFFAAVGAGKRKRVLAALNAGLPIDTQDYRGRTGFLHAVAEEQDEIAELLRERGFDVNALDGSENNALSYVDSNERRKWLLELGVAASYRDSFGKLRQPGIEGVLEDDDPELLRTLLDSRCNYPDLTDLSSCHSSMIWGNFEDRLESRATTLRTLGAAGADLEAIDGDRTSLLLGHINRAHEPCVLALLDVGVNLEHEDRNFTTPLIKSCAEYREHETHARITKALLARGADHRKIDWLGRSAWDSAESVSNRECQELLEQVFEQQRIDALAEHGLDPDTDPEQLTDAVFATLARRCDLESLRHWVRKREHALVRGLLRAGFDPNPPALDQHGLRPGSSALSSAISGGDEQMVEILLDGGANPNIVHMYGSTALSSAVSEQRVDLVKLVLAAGADPNIIDDWSHTAMSGAASHGNVSLLELLHQAGARVQPRASGRMPLWAAVRSGKFEAAQWLLAHGAHIDTRCEGRVTALHAAVEQDEVELALALIAAGADVNVQTSDDDKTTPLILATKKGQVELIGALLAAGADTRVQDAGGQSAADHAAFREELRALFPEGGGTPIFMKIERDMPALIRAVHCGDRAGFTAALEDGVDVTNYRGDTALMFAAAYRQLHMLEALLEAGADLHAANSKGDNAWTYAFTSGAEQIRLLLEERGFKNSMDALNQMAAQAMRRDAAKQAIEAGDIGRVAKLIDELEADVDFLAPGVRPLQIAIDRGDAALVSLLLAKGADASLPDSSGVSLRERAEAAGIEV
jgi:ankyrin repeat protein